MRNTILVWNPRWKRPLDLWSWCRWEDNIEMYHGEICLEDVRIRFVYLGIVTGGEILWTRQWIMNKFQRIPWLADSTVSFSRRILLHGVIWLKISLVKTSIKDINAFIYNIFSRVISNEASRLHTKYAYRIMIRKYIFTWSVFVAYS